MTCIVELIQEGEVWMAADGMVSFGEYATPRQEPKFFRTNGPAMLIGVSGSPRVGNLLAHSFKVPPHTEGVEVLSYICGPFAQAIRLHCIDNRAWTSADELADNAHLLVAYQNRLFYGDQNLAFYEPIRSYEATGSGCEVALGSLHATAQLGDFSPQRRLNLALEAATEMIRSCSPPFHIEKL